MAELDRIFSEINYIKSRVESIDKSMDQLIVFNADRFVALFREEFKKDGALEKVFLSVTGERTQDEIVQATGMSQPTVSRRLKKLIDDDLVEIIVRNKLGNVYSHTKLTRLLKLNKTRSI